MRILFSKIRKTIAALCLIGCLTQQQAHARFFDQDPTTSELAQLITALAGLPASILAQEYPDSNGLALLEHVIKASHTLLALSNQSTEALSFYQIETLIYDIICGIKNIAASNAKSNAKKKNNQPTENIDLADDNTQNNSQSLNEENSKNIFSPSNIRIAGILFASIEAIIHAHVARCNNYGTSWTEKNYLCQNRDFLNSLATIARIAHNGLRFADNKNIKYFAILFVINVVLGMMAYVERDDAKRRLLYEQQDHPIPQPATTGYYAGKPYAPWNFDDKKPDTTAKPSKKPRKKPPYPFFDMDSDSDSDTNPNPDIDFDSDFKSAKPTNNTSSNASDSFTDPFTNPGRTPFNPDYKKPDNTSKDHSTTDHATTDQSTADKPNANNHKNTTENKDEKVALTAQDGAQIFQDFWDEKRWDFYNINEDKFPDDIDTFCRGHRQPSLFANEDIKAMFNQYIVEKKIEKQKQNGLFNNALTTNDYTAQAFHDGFCRFCLDKGFKDFPGFSNEAAYVDTKEPTTADCLRVLGLNGNASWNDIKLRYHQLTQVQHPDKNKDFDKATQDQVKLNEAYTLLQKRYKKT